MIKYADSKKDWLTCDFSNLGFIGKMFQIENLLKFNDFNLAHYKEKPVDWNLDDFLKETYCQKDEKNCFKGRINNVHRFFRRPPLFQVSL
jgi:hypothetical protein